MSVAISTATGPSTPSTFLARCNLPPCLQTPHNNLLPIAATLLFLASNSSPITPAWKRYIGISRTKSRQFSVHHRGPLQPSFPALPLLPLNIMSLLLLHPCMEHSSHPMHLPHPFSKLWPFRSLTTPVPCAPQGLKSPSLGAESGEANSWLIPTCHLGLG